MFKLFDKIENLKTGETEYYPTWLGWLAIMGFISCLCGLAIFGLAKVAGAAWIYETDFESSEGYTLGSFGTCYATGQGDWYYTCGGSGQTFIISDAQAYSGSQSALFGDYGGDTYGATIRKTITETNQGEFFIAFRPDSITAYGNIRLLDTELVSNATILLRNDGKLIYLLDGATNAVYGDYSANTWYIANFQFDLFTGEHADYRLRIYNVSTQIWGNWTDWINGKAGGATQNLKYISLYGSNQVSNFQIAFDLISITDPTIPPPPAIIEFINPLNSQSLPDFQRWEAKITYQADTEAPLLLIVGYSDGASNWYDWSLPSYSPKEKDLISYWAFFKTRLLALGSYTGKFFLHQTDSIDLADPENLLAESSLINFTITAGTPLPTPAFPSPSPQFSTSSWEITEEYALQNYASNVPAIFGTTTPFSFYLTITSGYRNFIKPFAEFVLSLKTYLKEFISEGYGDKISYMLAFANYNLQKIFNLPIIPIFSTYILFLIVFFIVKLIFKTLRG